ncbi:hypothetical protein KMW28_20970 [Flammeovirga yaeyamensis]|uniref:Uncharacterized protein n=1 Tax=Flammeovirga yaeyamensis TaxID=367791 RepID=A0AAX1NFF6_9BACT|nr:MULTISPECIES: hypothetical protein [Flammeovirga]ANQ52631.1 hypothetical protein MY04_5299 [Flammeovirga sp. MY04]MBB3697179.1 hypothetical protein [Flammeovirga yaeyamensis]NMF33839.1 hypothetical protein [Flammeovirga yaeyamensis]QWG04898.1 hypothetical protein KMW28_20970 [Flammeovirga yaeyamensis]
MKDLFELLKGFVAIALGVVLVFGTVFLVLPKDHNLRADVPQTHVYIGQDVQ